MFARSCLRSTRAVAGARNGALNFAKVRTDSWEGRGGMEHRRYHHAHATKEVGFIEVEMGANRFL